jgi:hypothetical protein
MILAIHYEIREIIYLPGRQTRELSKHVLVLSFRPLVSIEK